MDTPSYLEIARNCIAKALYTKEIAEKSIQLDLCHIAGK